MSLRFPDLAAKLRRAEFELNPLDGEIAAEKASALGHRGRMVEKAVQDLRTFDTTPGGDPEARRALVATAAKEVWAFFVQRELCGLRDQKEVIRHYGIPQDVLVRLGAVEPRQR